MPVDHGPPAVAEIPYGGDAGRELPGERRLDGLVELVGAQAGLFIDVNATLAEDLGRAGVHGIRD